MIRHPLAGLVSLVVFAPFAGCAPSLTVPSGADVTCAADAGECPAGLVCLTTAGRCVEATGPCVAKGTANAVADGTACDDGICVAGACVTPGCGDGFVDLAAGEACDPGAAARAGGAACRDDCILPFCGDGVVDPGETCEVGDVDCVACSVDCIRDANRGNCNRDGADGCECALSPLDIGDVTIVSAELVDGELWAAVRRSADFALVRVNLDSGAVTPLLEGLVWASVTLDDAGALFAGAWDGATDTSTLYARDGARLTPLFAGPDGSSVITVARDRIYTDSFEVGTVEVDRASGAQVRLLSDKCDNPARTVLCGDEILCAQLDTDELWAIATADGTARLLQTTPSTTFGCSDDGVALWHDGAHLFFEDGAKTAHILAALPGGAAGGLTTTPSAPLLFVDGAPLLTVSAATADVFAVTPTGGLLGVARGLLGAASADGDVVVIVGVGQVTNDTELRVVRK